MQVRFFDPGQGYKNLRPEIDLEMQRVLSAGDLILRKDVEIFEEKLANFVGTKYAVAVSSGTDALYLALKSLNVVGQHVAVPSHTFKATAGSIVNSGNIPLVYDMDEEVTALYRIPVHIAGELVATEYKGIVIEDACQALGAVKNPTTSAQCWSFYPAKILGAYGDAGAVTTNDENIADYIREARNHFKTDNRDFGGNYRMDNLQAAILNVKFKYLPLFLERRRMIAKNYLAEFEDLPLGLPKDTPERVWQDFIVRTKKRDELFDFLKKEGVETIKNEYPWSPEYPKLPLAAKYEAETLRLPCNPELHTLEVLRFDDFYPDELAYVIKKVKEFYT